MPDAIFEKEEEITVERMRSLDLEQSSQLATVGIFVELRKIRELLEKRDAHDGTPQINVQIPGAMRRHGPGGG